MHIERAKDKPRGKTLNDSTGLLGHLKAHGGSYAGAVCTLTLTAVIAFGNLRAGGQHNADEMQQLKSDVATMKLQIANDLATRREVDDVKQTVIRIEDKLDKELEFHRRNK